MLRRTRSLLAVGLLVAAGADVRAVAAPHAVVPTPSATRPVATAPEPLAASALAPLRFVANAGQTGERARVVALGSQLSAAFAPDTVVASAPGASALAMHFAGADRSARVAPERPTAGATNVLVGDASRRRVGLESYSGARTTGLYDGVDAVFSGSGAELSCAFEVAPGADPGRIHLTFDSPLRLDPDGALVVGDARVRLAASQTVGGVARRVAARFRVERDGGVTFEVGELDKTLALTVAPVLSFSTFLGGDTGGGAPTDVAVGADGMIYVVGFTSGTDFPTAGTPFQAASAGSSDAIVCKIDPNAGALIYSTYLGGSSSESANGIAVDAAGDAYVTGVTGSANFPTVNPAQSTNMGFSNAFVAELNPSGSALVYSTFLGGSGINPGFNGSDVAFDIAVDAVGAAYVCGLTTSNNFPTVGAVQPAEGSEGDGFVTKVAPGGGSFVYSTYLGGNNDDWAYGIAVDGQGRAVVTGETISPNFPRHSALQNTFAGVSDAFVTRYTANGAQLDFSTFVGGSSRDQATDVKVDSAGNVYVTGFTGSTNFPTHNPIQAANAGGQAGMDTFVTEVSASGASILFSTYLGGSGDEYAQVLALGSAGHVFVAGYTTSTNFPTVAPFQSAFGGGQYDGYVARIDLTPTPTLVYSTYLGGSADDQATGIAVDPSGAAIIVGGTISANFPLAQPFDATIGSGKGFVTRLATPTQHADTPGIYDPSNGFYFLKNASAPGSADLTFGFGPAGGVVPISGDWNGDGTDTPGIYVPASGAFFLKNTNAPGNADIVFGFGAGGQGYVPLVGDWNGDGVDTVGLYRPTDGFFFLRNANASGVADLTFGFGPGGSVLPLTGDWNGDGTDTPGIYVPATGTFFLSNANAPGPAELAFGYGGPNAVPLSGDWNGDGVDSVGIYVPASGAWFLRNANSSGPADLTFVYGPPDATPLVGDWNGL